MTGFEWDPGKAPSNLSNHGVDFVDVIPVFFDEMAITIPDEDSDEERFVTVGADALNRVLVVIYTWLHESIRIISARKAVRRERRPYEEQR